MKMIMTLAAAAIGFAGIIGMAGSAAAQSNGPTVLKFCTGAKGGVYEYFGATLQKNLRGAINVQLVPTTGGWDNLQKIASGECDAGLAQSDNVWAFNKENANALNIQAVDTRLYTEYFTLICNRESDVKSFSDLNKNTTVYTGGRGTGSDVSLRALIKAKVDAGYPAFKDIPLDNTARETALIALNGGQGDCLAYVGAPGSQAMKDVEKFSDNLVIVPVEDSSFSKLVNKDKKGRETKIWDTDAKITSEYYGKLMPDGRLWGKKDVPTVGIAATLLIASVWVDSYGSDFSKFGLAVPDVKNLVRSAKNLK